MLATGDKVPKDSIRIECYGTVDELNSFTGLLKDSLRGFPGENFSELVNLIEKVQNELFDLGGELATPPKFLNPLKQKVIGTSEIQRLENEIDRFNQDLPALTNFILPGGLSANSLAHICRTVCRRAERLAVTLKREDEMVRGETIIYLNRLSDWFFILARTISRYADAPEVLWQQERPIKNPNS